MIIYCFDLDKKANPFEAPKEGVCFGFRVYLKNVFELKVNLI